MAVLFHCHGACASLGYTALCPGARLAPDMLPLTRHIQIAADIARNSVARLAGEEPPRFDDNESTIEEPRARVLRAPTTS